MKMCIRDSHRVRQYPGVQLHRGTISGQPEYQPGGAGGGISLQPADRLAGEAEVKPAGVASALRYGASWQYPGGVRPAPVSYTHLDVYKRQEQRDDCGRGKQKPFAHGAPGGVICHDIPPCVIRKWKMYPVRSGTAEPVFFSNFDYSTIIALAGEILQ